MLDECSSDALGCPVAPEWTGYAPRRQPQILNGDHLPPRPEQHQRAAFG
jgi:hypothetical protein